MVSFSPALLYRRHQVKLPAHTAGLPGHASGEQNVSKGSFLHIVPPPACR